jgi:sugar lactone lactonase YvrE
MAGQSIAMSGFEIVSPDRFGTGECPTWDEREQRLLWTSIHDGDIHVLSVRTGERSKWHFDSSVGAFGLCRNHCLVVALHDSVVRFDPRSGALTTLAQLPQRSGSARLNDGKVGPDGAFWVGGMDREQPNASLYRVAADGSVTEIVGGLRASNGLAWSPDASVLYHSDSRGPWVDRWDFDAATGRASNRRRFLDLDDATGRPDGATVDAEGCYWSAGVSAGRLNRFAPDGTLLGFIDVPSFRPTMPCFGGEDLKTIYVTSLSGTLTDEERAAHPHAGQVLAMKSRFTGLPTYRFGD